MTAFITVSGVLLLFAVLVLTGSWITYNMTFRRHGSGEADPYRGLEKEKFSVWREGVTALINRLKETPFEEVSIVSRDGLTLRGRYYHVRDGALTEIQLHGYRSTPLKDFCGGGCAALDRGHNLLLVDQRAHEHSDGRTISFGIKERYDCLDWISYVNGRSGKDTPIVLVGISMGAATVLMASGLELPENVIAVVADCPYSSPKEIIIKVAREMGFPGGLLFPLVRLGGLIFGGFDVTADSPVKAVASSRTPTIIIHGEEDGFVPCEMSLDIFNAIPHGHKKRVTFPKADHGISYLHDTEKYVGSVDEFISDALKRRRESENQE